MERKETMKVGMLTAPFSNETLDTVIDFAEEVDIPCLEVVAHPGSKHINPSRLTPARAAKIRQAVAERGMEITSLAYYADAADPKKRKAIQAHAKKTIDAAAMLGVPTVCMLAGMPVEGLSILPQIDSMACTAAARVSSPSMTEKIVLLLEPEPLRSWRKPAKIGISRVSRPPMP